ncbi:hypothetical protein [Embleya hyalina]|uniref:Uncharacterized protein n=1 Tax=Embleya hyalina TaxID=516124 RepID=A0A401YZ17_9ACTN|nr:hypothetical protein [Embleya hyalina]GCD99869.1 hypothetical protein EHYA_07591 [Embleya hyalina]
MPNVLEYNGTAWVERVLTARSGTSWGSAEALYWDGLEWRTGAPPAQEFPIYRSSSQGETVNSPSVELRLPAVAVSDLVVSVCTSVGPIDRAPSVVAPAGLLTTQYRLRASGVLLQVVMWPWAPERGKQVVWDLGGAAHAAVTNLVYRAADLSALGVTPVVEIKEVSNSTEIPLAASRNHTTLYLAATVSSDLTGAAWPPGVMARTTQLGVWGEDRVSVLTADTPGAGASPGSLRLDTAVRGAACVVITIPGQSDGLPTWILGDLASRLGPTTYLG